jgi:hypothetical protein
MVDRLNRFGSNLRSDTARMLSAMRKAMHEQHASQRESRCDFVAGNRRAIHDMMHTLHAERARARRHFMGKKA